MGNDNTALTLSVERIMNQCNLTICYFQVHSYYDYIYPNDSDVVVLALYHLDSISIGWVLL